MRQKIASGVGNYFAPCAGGGNASFVLLFDSTRDGDT
jgi:hypothetical protein